MMYDAIFQKGNGLGPQFFQRIGRRLRIGTVQLVKQLLKFLTVDVVGDNDGVLDAYRVSQINGVAHHMPLHHIHRVCALR